MGDSATQLWTSSPQQLFVNHNDEILSGSNNFQVEILDVSGNPLSGVTVTLYKPGFNNTELQLTSLSNHNGIADFNIGDYNQGSVFVTSRCQNCIPVETNVEILSNCGVNSRGLASQEVNLPGVNPQGRFNPPERLNPQVGKKPWEQLHCNRAMRHNHPHLDHFPCSFFLFIIFVHFRAASLCFKCNI